MAFGIGHRGSGGRAAALGTGGLAAAAALAWFLAPRRGAERRAHAAQALRAAPGKARAQLERLEVRVSERAGRAAQVLHEARARRPGAPAGAAAAFLLVRAVLGRGFLRLPGGILGAWMLARAAPVRRGLGSAAGLVRGASERVRASRPAASASSSGGEAGEAGATAPDSARRPPEDSARRPPEVVEVKSPAELEPGVARGRPEPTYRDRADRSGPHVRRAGGSGAGRPSPQGRGPAMSPPGSGDVTARSDFDAPEPGSPVRTSELGAVAPREGEPAADEDEGAPHLLGPDGAPLGGGRNASRLEAPDGSPLRREAPADAVDPAERRAAGETELRRREPTGDGG